MTVSKKEIVLTSMGVGLCRESQCLVVKHEGKKVFELPKDQVDGVYVLTTAASITAEAVRSVAESGASLSFFNRRGEPYAFLISPNSLANAPLRVKQIDTARSEKGLSIAKSIITGKIGNQAATLKYFSKSRKKVHPGTHKILNDTADRMSSLKVKLDSIEGESGHTVRSEIMAVEAEAAALYWDQLRGLIPDSLDFKRRVRRGATDPVNSALNYGYGILYAKVFSKIAWAGLDPYVGFFHAWQDGKATLLFDFVEMFRQYFVDRPIFSWLIKKGRPRIDNDRLTMQTRKRISGMVLDRLNDKVTYKGENMAAENVILKKAQELASEIQEGPSHEAYIWPW